MSAPTASWIVRICEPPDPSRICGRRKQLGSETLRAGLQDRKNQEEKLYVLFNNVRMTILHGHSECIFHHAALFNDTTPTPLRSSIIFLLLGFLQCSHLGLPAVSDALDDVPIISKRCSDCCCRNMRATFGPHALDHIILDRFLWVGWTSRR
jgi:hypothetical protein